MESNWCIKGSSLFSDAIKKFERDSNIYLNISGNANDIYYYLIDENDILKWDYFKKSNKKEISIHTFINEIIPLYNNKGELKQKFDPLNDKWCVLCTIELKECIKKQSFRVDKLFSELNDYYFPNFNENLINWDLESYIKKDYKLIDFKTFEKEVLPLYDKDGFLKISKETKEALTVKDSFDPLEDMWYIKSSEELIMWERKYTNIVDKSLNLSDYYYYLSNKNNLRKWECKEYRPYYAIEINFKTFAEKVIPLYDITTLDIKNKPQIVSTQKEVFPKEITKKASKLRGIVKSKDRIKVSNPINLNDDYLIL